MGKREEQGRLFGDLSAAAAGGATARPVPSRALRVVATPDRPLTKAQKKFDRLLRKVETLRTERTRATARWDAFVKTYREQIHPEERRMAARRKQVALLLAAWWRKPKGFGKLQREQLEELLAGHLHALAEEGPELMDEELRALLAELLAPSSSSAEGEGDAPDEAARAADQAAMPPELRELIDRLGLDARAFHSRMSPEEMMAEIERQMGDGPGAARDDEAGGDADARGSDAGRGAFGGAEGSRDGGRRRESSARQTAAERKVAERAAAREEARKRTVVSIYKQLAKVLHPDLEQDPAMRARKHTLMQELTKAYREGDLHTLLRLELEWLDREEGDLARLSDEKVGVYCELLEEQVEELQAEIQDVPFSPRFAAVARFARPFGQGPQSVESILLSIRRLSESLRRFRDDLTGPRSREHLREALRDVAAQRREAERWGAFMDEF
jgi:hypothetical protein